MASPATFAVDCTRGQGQLPRLWNSTGFTPGPLLLSPAMRQALQWYGAIPDGGMRHCRVHYLLDLLAAKGLEDLAPVYDWSRLDRGLDILVDAGLAPFFELMGDPTGPRIEDGEDGHYGAARKGRRSPGYFRDFCQPRQQAAWRMLVRDVARHCLARYGAEEVRSWHWEVWNEPDVGWFGQGIPQLKAYTSACVEGLREADPALRFGGPGTCRTLSEELVQWLDHCDAEGLPLAFLSVHEKGIQAHVEDVRISTPGIVARTRALVEHLRARHPRLAALPLMNDECDPIVGWGHIHSYHARPWYAGWVLRVIDLHLRELVDGMGVDLRLLGNDHGFLGPWGARGMLAHLHAQERGSGMFPRSISEDERFLLVKKPVYNAHVALALLGGERLASTSSGNPDCGLLATRDEGAVAIAYYHHRDRSDHGGFGVPASLAIDGLADGPWRLVHYRIDDGAEHPFELFAQGPCEPPEPAMQRRYLACGELRRLGGAVDVAPDQGRLALAFDLPLPAMGLILLLRDPGQPPGQVTGLRGEVWPGLSADEQVMLRWRGLPARSLATYEVEREEGGVWRRINAPDTLCSAWLDLRPPRPDGVRYRVRAVDHWGRAGAWSAMSTC